MARKSLKRKREEMDERVAQRMELYESFLGGLEGAKRVLVINALQDYCYVDVQLEDVKELVLKEGMTILNKQGNVVRNPNVMTQHQLMNEKNALFSKIVKQLEGGDDKNSDELLGFLGA